MTATWAGYEKNKKNRRVIKVEMETDIAVTAGFAVEIECYERPARVMVYDENHDDDDDDNDDDMEDVDQVMGGTDEVEDLVIGVDEISIAEGDTRPVYEGDGDEVTIEELDAHVSCLSL